MPVNKLVYVTLFLAENKAVERRFLTYQIRSNQEFQIYAYDVRTRFLSLIFSSYVHVCKST